MAKTAIVDVYNTCNGDTDIIHHARNSQYENLQKTRNESLQRHKKVMKHG